jgi:rhamnosyltransferase
MSNPAAISIVIRSKNDAALIGSTLAAVHRQVYAGPVEIIHIDSGSTDPTVDIIRSFQPHKIIQIKAEEYVPGVVLNRGMREAGSSWVIFLNSDCTPLNENWLAEMMGTAQRTPDAGAVYGRQVPRPDCQAVYAHDYDRCFGAARDAQDWEHFFSMANSAVRRAAWEELPFREDLQYSEDDEWSRRLIQHGWDIAYAEGAPVLHSHNYTLPQAFRRSYGEAYALAALDAVSANHYNLPRILAGGARESLRDLAYCLRRGRLAEWPHALAVRAWQRTGRFQGFRAGWAHYQPNNGSQL